MDLLNEVLVNEVGDVKDQLLLKLDQEIEVIEKKISQRLSLKNKQQFKESFHELNEYLITVEQELNQADKTIEKFENETCRKVKQMKESLNRKKKSMLSNYSQNGDNSQALDIVNKSSSNLDNKLAKEVVNLSLSKEPIQEEARYSDICIDYIIKARNLVTLNWHPLVEVGSENIIDSNCQSINQSLFDFPKCKISESTFHFIELMQDILQEASKRENVEEQRSLISTARDVCELYLVAFLVQNKEKIQSLHQSFSVHTAIFHNNCMYIAHQLLILPFDYHFANTDLVITFIDYVLVFRDTAYNQISQQMEKQRGILNEYFHDSLVVQCLTDNLNHQFSDQCLTPLVKALKLSMNHLTSLKDIWIEILPPSVCNKLIATLLNHLIGKLINQMLNMEDIPSHIATSLFKILQANTSDIDQLMSQFLLPFDQVIPKWQQFQSLKIILQVGWALIFKFKLFF